MALLVVVIYLLSAAEDRILQARSSLCESCRPVAGDGPTSDTKNG